MHDGVSFLVFLGVCATVFGLITSATGAAGVQGSWTVLAVTVLASVALASSLFLLRLFRWELIWKGLGGQLPWIGRPDVVVGIGPGGAVIAGMIAKRLVGYAQCEPIVVVADRTFKNAGNRLVVEIGEVALPPASEGAQQREILVVGSEVHSGGTMAEVCRRLDDAGIDHRTFSFLVSPNSNFKVDNYVLRSDSRGIIPWPDAPEREVARNG